MPKKTRPAAAGEPRTGQLETLDSPQYSGTRAAEQAPQTPFEWALEWARRGVRVFPCEPGSKVPAIDGWQARATTDPDQIREWWHCPLLSLELPRNPATPTGNGLMVVDLDTGDGRDGPGLFATWCDVRGWEPNTLRIATAGGGQHLWFRVDGRYGNPVGYPAPGIDVRCDGGLVLLPGAVNDNGKPYVLLDDLPLEPIHPNFLEGLRQREAPADPVNRLVPVVELDGPGALARAKHYLENEAPAAIWNGTGNTTTFKVAAHLKDLGVSEPMALELMLEHWNEKCAPPWEADELSRVVGNAYRYGANRPGSAAPRFPALVEQPEVIEAERRLELPESATHAEDTILDWDDEEDWNSEPEPLVDGLINQGEVGFIYGSPGAGKSFLAIRLSRSVATGEPFGERFTTPGGVLYLMGEAHGGAKKRKAAARKLLGGQDVPMRLVLTNLNLLRKGAEQVLRHCERFKDTFGALPKLIILDTLGALAAGFGENDADQATLLLHRLRQIATVTGSTVLIVAHEGKDSARGLRGSSALLGAADFVLHADKAKMTLSAEKLREDEIPPKMGYELVGVEVGRRRDGRIVRSAVANILTKPKPNLAALEAELRPEQREFLQIIRTLIADRPTGDGGLTAEEIAKEATAHGAIDAASGKAAVDSARNRLKRLQKTGIVVASGDKWLLASDAESEAEAA
jgi:hypothetical protein